MTTMRQRRRRFNTTETTVVTVRLPMAWIKRLKEIPHSDLMRAMRKYLLERK